MLLRPDRRRKIAQTAVRSEPVVILAPFFNADSRLVQIREPFLVQAFVSHLAVERFDDRILNRLARLNKVQFHTAPEPPLIQSPTCELRAIIDLNRLWQSSRFTQSLQHSHHTLAR